MKNLTGLFLLRVAVAIILLAHSIPVLLNGGVNDFGRLYLDAFGFAPFGILIAWAIKLSHVAAAVAILTNRFVPFAVIVTVFILVMGIFMVHLENGWFVVGNGRNGVEFNFLLIFALIAIAFPNGFGKAKNA